VRLVGVCVVQLCRGWVARVLWLGVWRVPLGHRNVMCSLASSTSNLSSPFSLFLPSLLPLSSLPVLAPLSRLVSILLPPSPRSRPPLRPPSTLSRSQGRQGQAVSLLVVACPVLKKSQERTAPSRYSRRFMRKAKRRPSQKSPRCTPRRGFGAFCNCESQGLW